MSSTNDSVSNDLYQLLENCSKTNIESTEIFKRAAYFIGSHSNKHSEHIFNLERSLKNKFVNKALYDRLYQHCYKHADLSHISDPALIDETLMIPSEKITSKTASDFFDPTTSDKTICIPSTPSDITLLADSKGQQENFTDKTQQTKNPPEIFDDQTRLTKPSTLPSTIRSDETLYPSSAESKGSISIGTILKNRFILEENIGSGGMGTVYRARDLIKEEMNDESSLIAIKVLNKDLRGSQDALIALQRESVKSQKLAHPNIVTVYDFDRDGDLVYMSMEYLNGKTLDELIKGRYFNKLSVVQISKLIELIARALAYAHQKGFAHADLKPGNIMLTHSGNIKVLDFGIAQAIRGANDHTPLPDEHYDSIAMGAITPNFASPEMLEEQTPTPADDIFSLGCVAYALFTGRHPFTDESGNKVTSINARNSALTLKKVKGLPRRQMLAIQKSLLFTRSQRFQNAGDFLDAFKAPVKLKRWVFVLCSVLLIVALTSWWITFKQSTIAIGLNDLPLQMSELVKTIELADKRFDVGDIDQAHKLYAQAWESSFDLGVYDQRDQLSLKVIIDRRIDAIIEYLIIESQHKSISEFRLLQLQVALEFLKQGELGTKDSDIERTLIDLRNRIDQLSIKPL